MAQLDFRAHYGAVDQQDEYRRNAAEAQRQADRAINEPDRAAWLRLVEGWLSLLPKRRRSPQESFEQQLSDEGTGQDENNASN
ncbi:hypothetical protein [Bradyrhizobium sp. McL0616]|uniref:hypothetical protein n=1 Tax=Bradyrhizobium sp. McL0616 TaxID=3415674 RepID=UPI003CF8AB5E